MKYEDIRKWVDKPEEVEIDFTASIVHDSFYSSVRAENYRDKAIRRLIASNLPWYSVSNISWHVARNYVRVVCPYCSTMMNWNGSTGSMYICPECKAVANIPAENISFTPPKKEA